MRPAEWIPEIEGVPLVREIRQPGRQGQCGPAATMQKPHALDVHDGTRADSARGKVDNFGTAAFSELVEILLFDPHGRARLIAKHAGDPPPALRIGVAHCSDERIALIVIGNEASSVAYLEILVLEEQATRDGSDCSTVARV